MKLKKGDKFKTIKLYRSVFVAGEIVYVKNIIGEGESFCVVVLKSVKGPERESALRYSNVMQFFVPYKPQPKGHPLTKVFK